MKKYIDKFHVWHMVYRQEIIWFVVGFVVGAILLWDIYFISLCCSFWVVLKYKTLTPIQAQQ